LVFFFVFFSDGKNRLNFKTVLEHHFVLWVDVVLENCLDLGEWEKRLENGLCRLELHLGHFWAYDDNGLAQVLLALHLAQQE
jgi:hypothetical protein